MVLFLLFTEKKEIGYFLDSIHPKPSKRRTTNSFLSHQLIFLFKKITPFLFFWNFKCKKSRVVQINVLRTLNKSIYKDKVFSYHFPAIVRLFYNS